MRDECSKLLKKFFIQAKQSPKINVFIRSCCGLLGMQLPFKDLEALTAKPRLKEEDLKNA